MISPMAMKPYRCILFDWDGCIARTLSLWSDAISASLAEEGITASEREVGPLIGNLYDGAIALGVKPENWKLFKDRIYLFMDGDAHGISLYDGAKKMLERTKSSGRMTALISSSSKLLLEKALIATEVRPYFDVVISGSDVKRRKPDPEGISAAMSLLGAETSNSIMVGDSEFDIKAASNAGIDSVLFYPQAHSAFYSLDHLKKCNPTYIVGSHTELEQMLG